MGLRSDNAGVGTVLVVEGPSDQLAIEALAERRGVDLAAAGVRVVRLGGAHRIGTFLDQLGRTSDRLRLAGLCDAGCGTGVPQPRLRGAAPSS